MDTRAHREQETQRPQEEPKRSRTALLGRGIFKAVKGRAP